MLDLTGLLASPEGGLGAPLLKHRSRFVRRARTDWPSAIGGFIAYERSTVVTEIPKLGEQFFAREDENKGGTRRDEVPSPWDANS